MADSLDALGPPGDPDLRIRTSRAAELRRFLEARPEENLFHLSVLQERGIASRPGESPFHFAGWPATGPFAAVAFLGGHWFAGPYAPRPEDASALGHRLRSTVRLRRAVGERSATDAFWKAWSEGQARTVLSHPQQLMRVRQGDPTSALSLPGLRPAMPSEERIVHDAAAAMQLEELGVDPRTEEPAAFRTQVADRIRAERTWVLVAGGEIVFKAEIALRSRFGAQLGGIWVPPAHRGQGLASRGVSHLTRRLLESDPVVSLHVHERNLPAVAAYRRAGYRDLTAFRLVRGEPMQGPR